MMMIQTIQTRAPLHDNPNEVVFNPLLNKFECFVNLCGQVAEPFDTEVWHRIWDKQWEATATLQQMEQLFIAIEIEFNPFFGFMWVMLTPVTNQKAPDILRTESNFDQLKMECMTDFE